MGSLLWALSLACLLPAWVLAATDIDNINGTIRIESGQTTGQLSTVNGMIFVGANCVVVSAHTVNSEISLGTRTRAGSVEAVNGKVSLARTAFTLRVSKL